MGNPCAPCLPSSVSPGKMLGAVATVAGMAARGFGLEADAFTSRMQHAPHLLAPTGVAGWAGAMLCGALGRRRGYPAKLVLCLLRWPRRHRLLNSSPLQTTQSHETSAGSPWTLNQSINKCN